MSKPDFTVTARLHPGYCLGCDIQVQQATTMARIQGSVEAMHREERREPDGTVTVLHSATVRRNP